MSQIVKIADNRGRISLPGFANATVILELIGPNEYRVRKADLIPERAMPLVLSERDARTFLESLEQPPPPNAAARRAAKRFKKQYG